MTDRDHQRRRLREHLLDLEGLKRDLEARTKDTRIPIVIAGTHQQFLLWCREMKINPGSRQAVFASSWDRLVGCRPDTHRIYRYGTRPENYWQLVKFLTDHGFKI